jgi:hypothetical protein
MHAVPIQMSAMIQIPARAGVGTKRAATMIAFGIHHADALVRGLLSQSRELWTTSFAMMGYLAQHEAAPVSPERSAWIGGQGTEPKEQNTQQSPGFGRSVAPQPVHV